MLAEIPLPEPETRPLLRIFRYLHLRHDTVIVGLLSALTVIEQAADQLVVLGGAQWRSGRPLRPLFTLVVRILHGARHEASIRREPRSGAHRQVLGLVTT